MRQSRRQTDEDFASFVEDARPSLSRTAWFLTGNREEAADLLQSALVKTYVAWKRLNTDTAAAYCRKVMANQNIDNWRKKTHVSIPETDWGYRVTKRESWCLASTSRSRGGLISPWTRSAIGPCCFRPPSTSWFNASRSSRSSCIKGVNNDRAYYVLLPLGTKPVGFNGLPVNTWDFHYQESEQLGYVVCCLYGPESPGAKAELVFLNLEGNLQIKKLY